MKSHLLFLMVILATTLFFSSLSAQNLVIAMDDGAQTSVPVTDVQKLTFDLNELILAYKSGQTSNYSLPDIQKLTFDLTVATGENPGVSNAKIKLFPNPAGSTAHLQNIPAECRYIRLFQVDGRFLKTFIVTGREMILPVEDLNPGMYFLSIDGQTVKLVKP